VDEAIEALQRKQGLRALTSIVASRKTTAVDIPSHEDDELAYTIDLTSPQAAASPIQERMISDLLDELLESSGEDDGSASDGEDDRDSGIGRVTISKVFDVEDEVWVEESEVRAGKKARIEVDDEVDIEEIDL
jgi:hypothetical protein